MIDWKAYGFRVCGEASDGEEALELIQKLNPDLVITDISMPVMDGLKLIQHCTKELDASCQFIVLSGHDDFAFAKQAMTCGVLDYWLKPIDVDEIQTSLEKLRREWLQRDSDKRISSQPAISSLGAARSIPEAGNPLFDAEDDLLLAIVNGEVERIDEAAERLCSELKQLFPDDVEASKSFLSHVLLELSWKVLEGELVNLNPSYAEKGKEDLPLPILPSRTDRWLEILLSYAHGVAELLVKQKSENGVIWEATRLIRERFHEPLQLQTIAKTLHFQPAYLGQLFKKQMGMSFLDYVHRTRIEESRKLLRRKDMKIADVARAVGYTDPEQFATKFKQWMNITPSQYKNN